MAGGFGTYDAYSKLTGNVNGDGITDLIAMYTGEAGIHAYTHKHYIYGGNNLVATYTERNNGTSAEMRYVHSDHLDSVNVITDDNGNVVQRLSFDPHGRRRNPDGNDATNTITSQINRGFTRHEHDDEVGLINMNARLYDPVIGRFITPDTIVQAAGDSQAYNRYSYVRNNPLSLVDPSGHSWLSKGLRKFRNHMKAMVRFVHRPSMKNLSNFVNTIPGMQNKYVRLVAAAVAAYYTFGASNQFFLANGWAMTTGSSAFVNGAVVVGSGVVAGATSGYVAGFVVTGTTDGARAGAKAGAISGGLFAGADLASQDWNAFGRITARATAGGLSSDLQGRDFAGGFRYNFLYYGAQEWTDYLARRSGLTVTDAETGKLRTDGTRNIDPSNRSVFGKFGMNLEGANHWYEKIPGVRNLIVDVSKVHDTMNSWRYSLDSGQFISFNNVWLDSAFDVYSFAGMLPAASFTLKGPQYGAPPYGHVYY